MKWTFLTRPSVSPLEDHTNKFSKQKLWFTYFFILDISLAASMDPWIGLRLRKNPGLSNTALVFGCMQTTRGLINTKITGGYGIKNIIVCGQIIRCTGSIRTIKELSSVLSRYYIFANARGTVSQTFFSTSNIEALCYYRNVLLPIFIHRSLLSTEKWI